MGLCQKRCNPVFTLILHKIYLPVVTDFTWQSDTLDIIKQGKEVTDMAGMIVLCKIVLLAAACVGAVWFGFWYKEHVE